MIGLLTKSGDSKVFWAGLLFVVAGFYLLLTVFILPAFSNANGGATSAACTQAQKYEIATGVSPGGVNWSVTGTLKNNGGCESWLLGMNFEPSGTRRGSWSGAWQIPAGGHLPKKATIAAQDDASGHERCVSGVVGSSVNRIIFQVSGGKNLIIHPKLPSMAIRTKFAWLRGLRYFVRYYGARKHVTKVQLLGQHGQLIYVTSGEEGLFEGPMGGMF